MQRVLLGIIVLVAALLSVEGALAQERVGTVDTVTISGAIDPCLRAALRARTRPRHCRPSGSADRPSRHSRRS